MKHLPLNSSVRPLRPEVQGRTCLAYEGLLHEPVASVGKVGDSHDAMAEAFNSLFKAECIRTPVMRPPGGWKSVGDVEIAVAEQHRLVQPPTPAR